MIITIITIISNECHASGSSETITGRLSKLFGRVLSRNHVAFATDVER